MFTLPLLVPQLSEALAAELLDRAAAGHGPAGAWPRLSGSAGTGDVLAWALVAFFLLTMAVFGVCVIAMRSRPRMLTPEQLLIEEVQRDEARLAASNPDAADDRQSWERPADWWQQAD